MDVFVNRHEINLFLCLVFTKRYSCDLENSNIFIIVKYSYGKKNEFLNVYKSYFQQIFILLCAEIEVKYRI